jgi:alpha-galactosidase
MRSRYAHIARPRVGSVLLAAVVATLAVPLVAPASPAHAADNGLSLRPAMGWSTWSFVRRNPTASTVVAQAEAMKHSGLAAHGFTYVNLDDFYTKCDVNGPVVDEFGRWVTDTDRFPGGIKAVADKVHALGLKFGIYVTPGIAENAVTLNTPIEGTAFHASDIADTTRTERNFNCKHMFFIDYTKPGAHEFVNSWAKLFASWGVDYLKIDGVGVQDIPDVEAWSSALRESGRPINFALSNNLKTPEAPIWRLLANSWRTQGDIECYCVPGGSAGPSFPLTNWTKTSSRFNSVATWQQFAGPGGWNDYDSLELGNGDNDGLTVAQRRSMFSLWAMAASPLILGSDLTHLDAGDLAMLGNDRVIAVDQDGAAASRIVKSGDGQVFAKAEVGGAHVVALFNTGETNPATVSVSWAKVGAPGTSHQVTDLWTGERTDVTGDTLRVTLGPGDVRLIRVQAPTSTEPGPAPVPPPPAPAPIASGGLPVTGTPVLATMATGLALMVFGVVLYGFGRRRRVRPRPGTAPSVPVT